MSQRKLSRQDSTDNRGSKTRNQPKISKSSSSGQFKKEEIKFKVKSTVDGAWDSDNAESQFRKD